MVKVKICGFTNPDDVKVACDLGADMVGVILVAGSSRCVTVEQARQILAAAPEGVAKVAVVRPRDLSELKMLAEELKPDYLQIHLTFPASELLTARGKLGAKFIVVAPIPREVENRQEVIEKARSAAVVADILLVDTKGPAGGGTGLTHDWSLSHEIRDLVDTPVMVAGGLNPSNVKAAIDAVRPYAVDVATGVESSPGKKDAKLMRDFIEAAREA